MAFNCRNSEVSGKSKTTSRPGSIILQRKRKRMRNIFLKALGGIALVICLSAMFTPAWGSGQGGGGRLEGTWDVEVTIRNCQTGAEIRSFASVTTFMFGGTTLDSTSGTPQAQRTPGQGVWSHVSSDTYRFSFKTFSLDAGGNFTAGQRLPTKRC